jgi:hypothetical protein
MAALVGRTYQIITNSRIQKSYIGFAVYFMTSILWSLFIRHTWLDAFYISLTMAVIEYNVKDYDNLYVLLAYYFLRQLHVMIHISTLQSFV